MTDFIKAILFKIWVKIELEIFKSNFLKNRCILSDLTSGDEMHYVPIWVLTQKSKHLHTHCVRLLLNCDWVVQVLGMYIN